MLSGVPTSGPTAGYVLSTADAVFTTLVDLACTEHAFPWDGVIGTVSPPVLSVGWKDTQRFATREIIFSCDNGSRKIDANGWCCKIISGFVLLVGESCIRETDIQLFSSNDL